MTSNLDSANAEMVRLVWEGQFHGRERREYVRLRALTDRLLENLERLNLKHPAGRRLSAGTLGTIAWVLEQLPDPVRRQYPECRTVQEALDSVFELQQVLKNWVRGEAMDFPLEELDASELIAS